jgi:uncharacterized protein
LVISVRLYALATKIGEGIRYDDDVVFAAAWMHDLGVFLGHRPSGPKSWRAGIVCRIRLRGVVSCCRGGDSRRRKSGDSRGDPYASAAGRAGDNGEILLWDEDFLEQLGAIGLVRAMARKFS